MKNGGLNLSYQLYTDATRTAVWDNVNTVPDANTPDGGSSFYTVYGQILSGQSLAPGTYTDTIIATVNVKGGLVSPTPQRLVLQQRFSPPA